MEITKLRELQAHFERTRAQTSNAIEMYKAAEEVTIQFQEKFSIPKLSSLSLEDYIIGSKNVDSFCHWLIYQTDKVGRIFVPGAAIAFGVYYSRDKKAYGIIERGLFKFVEKETALGKYETIRNGLIAVLADLAVKKDFEQIAVISEQTLDPLILGKVLSLYYPKEYIAIFSNRHVDDFLDALGIAKDNANLFQKREALLKFKKSDDVMSKWSNRKFVDFLYWEFFKDSNGYIADTDLQWFESFSANNKTKDGFVFWGNPDELPATEVGMGTTLFFAILEDDPPVIRGFAKVSQIDLLPLAEAWSKYGSRLGYESIEDALKTTVYSENKLTLDSPIFCIILKQLFETGIIGLEDALPNLGINLNKNQIFTGKLLSRNQTQKFLRIMKPQIITNQSKEKEPGVLEILGYNDIEELSKQTSISVGILNEWIDLLEERNQMIFYGPPGTGKTYVAEKFADYFIGKNGYRELVTFHPSYSYEDFIEGIRPKISPDGKSVIYQIIPGAFKVIAERARKEPNRKFVLLIDEINRGNIAKIFGELIHCLEYRGPEHKVRLLYSESDKETCEFFMPSNLYIIGTMNSADRSIALVDYALRRRFCFIDFMPNIDVLTKWLDENKANVDKSKVISFLQSINEAINADGKLGKHYQIGHSYFMRKDLDGKKLDSLWKYDILPLLEEYYFEDIPAIQKLEKLYQNIFPLSNLPTQSLQPKPNENPDDSQNHPSNSP